MGLSHLRRAIKLVNSAADGADDEEVTPAQIADEVGRALATSRRRGLEGCSARLQEALDAIADGMPADYVAGLLYSALALSQGAASPARGGA